MRAPTLFFSILLLSNATAARAADWEIDVDGRLVSSDGRRTLVDGGLGTLRFEEGQSGLRLGRARIAVSQALGEVWSLRLDASAWGDHDVLPVDLTEAYLQFRPYPRDGFRLRVKAGAFHAPISLENRAAGWESPYTLSYSAINTWLAEELRTIGIEGQLDWLGTRMGHGFDLAATGSVFGWNDPAGTVLANRGFTLNDRQTTLFGAVGSPDSGPLAAAKLFHEIDGRPGYYAGAEARYLDRLVVRALHYDSRGDPGAYSAALRDFAWATHFDSIGARLQTNGGWTAIAQWLRGRTSIEPADTYLQWPFDARFLLVSKEFREQRISLRYDTFEVRSWLVNAYGAQQGHAWTGAYVCEPGPHWRFTLEWLRVSSQSANRVLLLGEPGFAIETQLQLAIRYAFGPAVR